VSGLSPSGAQFRRLAANGDGHREAADALVASHADYPAFQAVFADAGSAWNYKGLTSYQGPNDPIAQTITPRDLNLIRSSVGVGLIWRSWLFHQVTDLWGDIPYTEALAGRQNTTPVYDPQQAVYTGLIADLTAGMYGAYGVLAALHERERTGRGRVVRTSLLAGMISVHAFQGTKWTVAGEIPGLSGDHHPSIAPYGMFATATAPIQIACGSEALWEALCGAIGLDPADPEFAANPARVARRDELARRLEDLFAAAPAEHWLGLLTEAGVPCGKVRTLDDVYTWDQTVSQGLVIEVEHQKLGTLRLPGSALRFDDNTFSGGRREHQPPPELGQHSDTVRVWADS
jgi:crotonobetainyl-CoA:carnitine CoA-transferase CaiB-like acyl-CoA transferase